MKSPELAVIINSYNRLPLLKNSLASVENSLSGCELDFILIVFDAGSDDGSLEYIKELKASTTLELLLMQASAGSPNSFSFGVNAACENAISNFPSVRYFLLYETDNYLHSGQPLKEALSLLKDNSNLAGCGFTVKKHNGSDAGFGSSLPSLTSFVAGQQFSFWLKLNQPSIHWRKHKKSDYFFCDVVYTSPLLIRRASWEKVNGFDHINFPFSDCDIDLAKRIQSSGEKLAVLKTNDVVHDNLEMKSDWSEKRTLNFYKARYTYFKKHVGSRIKLLIPFLFLTHMLEYLVLAALVISGKRNYRSLKTRVTLMKKVWNEYY